MAMFIFLIYISRKEYFRGSKLNWKQKQLEAPRNFCPAWDPGLLPLGPNVREDLRKKQVNQEKRSRAPKALCKSSASSRVRRVPASVTLKNRPRFCASEIRALVSTRLTFEKMHSSRPWRILRTSSREKWIADFSVDRVPRTSRGVDVLIFQNATRPAKRYRNHLRPWTFCFAFVMQSTYTLFWDTLEIIKFLFVK